MAQITSVTSEALQALIRRLLPSQQGFGEDLQASNVIIPIVDLTSTAEGSALTSNLQTAINFGGATAISLSAAGSATLANVGGFWRIFGVGTYLQPNSATRKITFSITDGSTTKIVTGMGNPSSGGINGVQSVQFDFTIYLNSGDSATVTTEANCAFIGSVRQVADINGNLLNPTGFTSE